jgi:ubiquinone/menaquinone biosynthesis C-methylase UbiE
VARYVIRGGRAGYERLQLLAKVWSPSTSDLFDRVGIAEGSRCLDVGCGGGEVTFEIARRVGPEGRVTGIDMDEIKLDLGREAAETRRLANVEFRATDVSDWHETAAYELVYCRFLLQHLSKPLDLLAKMWAAVAPGGALVVEDADFGALFCDPPNDGYEFWSRSYCSILERRGGDPLIGRKLYRFFLASDIRTPHMALVQHAHTSGEAKALSLSTLEATAEAILDEGVATEDEVAAAIASLAAYTAETGTIVSSPRIFQVWARKPE